MDLKEIWELTKTAGPFGTALMFYMWWRTDAKLTALQTSYNALLERVLTGLNGSTNSISDLKNFFTHTGRDQQ